MIDSGLVGSTVWEGYHESRRCSRDTYPNSLLGCIHFWVMDGGAHMMLRKMNAVTASSNLSLCASRNMIPRSFPWYQPGGESVRELVMA